MISTRGWPNWRSASSMRTTSTSEVRKGKRGGAFCASVTPGFTPYVLLNYQGKPDDVATMAHELGHAIHSMLAEEHSLFTFHSSLPLAETASTFGEMMLVDRLLKDEQDETVRRDLLFRQVDDAYATILRQAFFALFERQAHEMVQQGASVDELSAAYMENLKTQFGDAVEVATSSAGSGSPSRTSTRCRSTCMPIPLASSWCYPSTSSSWPKARPSSRATCRSWQRAARMPRRASWRKPASISTAKHSGRAVSMSSPRWLPAWRPSRWPDLVKPAAWATRRSICLVCSVRCCRCWNSTAWS